MLESNAMSIEALEKAAEYGSLMDSAQVSKSLSLMTLHTTSAEMWCRVGMLRAARKMVLNSCFVCEAIFCYIYIVYLYFVCSSDTKNRRRGEFRAVKL